MLKSNTQLQTTSILLTGLLLMPTCYAELRPLWEVGAGASVLSLPDYRGSGVTNLHVLPVPYLVYRGEFLKADRSGFHGILIDRDRFEVNISVNGTLPTLSGDNPSRHGMAELKPTVELGPTADFHLWQSADQDIKLDFRAPIRTSITIDSRPEQIGWLFSPNLSLDVRDPAGFPGWNLGLQAGPYFNDLEYNAFFYSVSPAEATTERPAYTASGGYSGLQITLSLTKRFPRYWIGGFMRYDNLEGAVFDDSPLVEKQHAFSTGIAMSWVFRESSRRVGDGE